MSTVNLNLLRLSVSGFPAIRPVTNEREGLIRVLHNNANILDFGFWITDIIWGLGCSCS